MARDRQLPGFLAKVHPTRRVPVNATFLVAVISLGLGLYMWEVRDDGITLLSTLLNFGAMTAFLVLHVSVVWHYVIRKKSRDWWKHLAVPVIGFGILLFVVINANVAAQTLGFIWLGIGVLLLVFLLVTGRKPEIRAEGGLGRGPSRPARWSRRRSSWGTASAPASRC